MKYVRTVTYEIEANSFTGAQNTWAEDGPEIADTRTIQVIDETNLEVPIPESVREVLADILSEAGIKKWWEHYLTLDPFVEEAHAREFARRTATAIFFPA